MQANPSTEMLGSWEMERVMQRLIHSLEICYGGPTFETSFSKYFENPNLVLHVLNMIFLLFFKSGEEHPYVEMSLFKHEEDNYFNV